MTDRRLLAILGAYPILLLFLSGYGIDRGYPTALYSLTVSLADQGTVMIDSQRPLLGYDYAYRDGHYYSDKAPGPSFLMLLPYVIVRRLTADPDLCFTLTMLIGLTLPAATAPLGLFVWCKRLRLPGKRVAVLGFAFGSLFFVYGTVGMADPLAAAFIVWMGAAAAAGPSLLAGLLAGMAILTRYQAALLVLPFIVREVIRSRRKSLRFLVPVGAALLLLMIYNAASFGHPLALSTWFWRGKQGLAPTLQMEMPSLGRLIAMTFGERRGLFLFTPILLAVPVGFYELRKKRAEALTILSGLLLFFGYLAMNHGYAGGADYGLRLSVPALPLLFVAVAAGGGNLYRRLRLLLIVPSVAIALLGALAGPYVPYREQHPIAYKAHDLWKVGSRSILRGLPKGAP